MNAITSIDESSVRVNVAVTAEADGSTTSQSATITLGAGTADCKVAYARQAEWPGGFVAAVTITNTAATALQSWTLSFRFPGDQQVTQTWNAVLNQSNGMVTATNTGYNATVAAGASVTVGLLGTWHAADPSPTGFTLNGRSCTIAA